MADAHTEISEEAVRAMFSDPEGPVGEIINAATEVVGAYAKATAPVSPRGSKYAPSGFLKGTVGPAERLHADESTGFVMGLAGTHTNRHGGGYPYPLAFISNPSGKTWNRGRRSQRRADNRFIQEATSALAGFVYYA